MGNRMRGKADKICWPYAMRNVKRTPTLWQNQTGSIDAGSQAIGKFAEWP